MTVYMNIHDCISVSDDIVYMRGKQKMHDCHYSLSSGDQHPSLQREEKVAGLHTGFFLWGGGEI